MDFDEIAPAHEELFHALDLPITRGIQTDLAASRHLYPAKDLANERETAALWVRAQLEGDPERRIAVVVPDLAESRPGVERIFRRILAPELNRVGAGVAEQAGPFEFSLGEPLARTPQAAVALDLLRLSQSALPLPAISALLLSPFFAAAPGTPEHLAAAEFDLYELRESQMLRPELSLDGLIRMLESSDRRPRLPVTEARLRGLREVARTAPPEASLQAHAAWSDHFRSLLQAAGWSAHARSSSIAFQVNRRWESALDELATLDFDGSRATAAEALAVLTRIAEATVFAPESRGAPVQILGPLELGGMPFDAVWFLAAGDLTWPPVASVSLLLPYALARGLGMPGTDAACDHTAACALTSRIAGSAAEVVFSFAEQLDDGQQRRSAVLQELDLETYQPAVAKILPPPLPLEHYADDTPLPKLPDRVIRGGATLLALQSACSFRAFAEQRLFSAEPGERVLGMDARDRGSLVHKVMELFWARVADSEQLKALSPDERHRTLDEAIGEVLSRPLSRARTAWEQAYLAAQHRRLLALLWPWLEVELNRPAFLVDQHETELQAKIGPLQLSLRVDRVDETSEGLVILDYKTGPATPSQWCGDRPDAPQLPLYAILSDPPPAGVGFALLRAGKDLALTGYADSPDAFGKPARMTMGMAEQLESWRAALTTLAEAFAAGEPEAAPKSYPKTCERCTQRILCRLDPATLAEICDEDPANPVPGEEPAYA